jgi:hypothetical protein
MKARVEFGNADDEVGRKLRVDELRERVVVCIRREDRTLWATMWVEAVSSMSVVFLAAAMEPQIHFMTFRRGDDTLVDESGRTILVHEYLGEV